MKPPKEKWGSVSLWCTDSSVFVSYSRRHQGQSIFIRFFKKNLLFCEPVPDHWPCHRQIRHQSPGEGSGCQCVSVHTVMDRCLIQTLFWLVAFLLALLVLLLLSAIPVIINFFKKPNFIVHYDTWIIQLLYINAFYRIVFCFENEDVSLHFSIKDEIHT